MQRLIEWLKTILRALLNVEKNPESEAGSNRGISAKAEYERCDSVLNASERKLFHDLVRNAPDSCFVLAKVRMEDVVRPSVKQDHAVHRAARSRVKSRHFDFVLIDTHGVPLVAIELDGPHHQRRSVQDGDRFKDEVCERVGLRLIRVPPGYQESRLAKELRAALPPRR
jgi:hypothetical protein